ncbi:MAG: hypothetical protein RR933_02460 [Oscillospiraceae bacterium]
MIIVSGVRIPLGENDESAVRAAREKLALAPSEIVSGKVRRVSYDSRHGSVSKVCSVLLELKSSGDEIKLCEKNGAVSAFDKKELKLTAGNNRLKSRPVVVGFGPSGMFAAYLLSEYGFRPIVIERGEQVENRVKSVEGFFRNASLNPESNVQFGEGGAGTFSDGKLTTRINDSLCDYVLDTLVMLGAPEDILYRAKPHIGTDRLRAVVRAMRERIIQNGGEFRFNTKLENIVSAGGEIRAVSCAQDSIETETVLLCCGHSARDTFEMLRTNGLELCAKPFSVGVRIEHLQEDIDRAVFGRHAGNPLLPKGEYALASKVNGRGVYTFCMCPGGTVVAAASESGGVVVNGMSEYSRGGKNANSAVAVSVSPSDFGSDPFDALRFQRELEQTAFRLGENSYRAPAQDFESFKNSKPGLKISSVEPTYPIGVAESDFTKLFGQKISKTLALGITELGKKLRGFDSLSAVLTGVETRTSSPIRIMRDELSREATRLHGLYPCGEGAGYAGGIMSAAVDGLKSASSIIEKYKPTE